MHDIEHKSTQEEPAFTSEQKGITTTGRQKLPRAWRYVLIGATVLLVLVVIFGSVLALANQRMKQSSVASTTPTTGATTLPTSTAGTSTIGATTLPTPASTPIPSPVPSNHNVNMTIADGVAYLSTADNALYALHASNGALLWHSKIDGSVDRQPLVANGIVYVTSYIGQSGPAYVYALRASDGSLLWRYSNTNYSYLLLSTSDSNIVLVASQGDISALNTRNGTVVWHFATKNTASESPLEVNGVVYFGSSVDNGPGTLYALRASDGTPLWHYATDGYINTPTVLNGVVYLTSGAVKLAALRASDGHQLWKQSIDANLVQSLQLVDGVIYTATTKILTPPAARIANPLQGATDIGALLWSTLQNAPAVKTVPLKEGLSSVYAIRASDGAILWHRTMNNDGESWASWFSVVNRVVYFSDSIPTNGTDTGELFALQSSNSSVLWHDKLNTSPTGALLANGVIYLSSSGSGGFSGVVDAVRASDGSLLWNYPLSGSAWNAPTLVGNTVYVGAANGMAYELRADNGKLLWHYLTNVTG